MATAPVEGAVGGEELRRALAAHPPRKILIEARDHVGDVVNTTGAIAAVIERFPGAEVTIEVGEGSASVLANFPGVSAIWPRKRHQGLHGKLGAVHRMKRGRFDLAVILDDSNEKIRMTAIAGIPLRVGVRKTKHADLFTASVPFDKEGHDLFKSLDSVLGLLGCRRDLTPRLFPSDEDRANAMSALDSSGAKGSLVGLHLGASEQKKQWPVKRFGDLALNLFATGRQPLLLAGPGEEHMLSEIQGAAPIVKSSLPLLSYAALVQELACLVTADSGPAHIAAAMGIPAVVLYGPTDPTRFYPFGNRHKLLYHSYGCSLYERVCASEAEGRHCDHACMRSIGVDEVVQAVLDVT